MGRWGISAETWSAIGGIASVCIGGGIIIAGGPVTWALAAGIGTLGAGAVCAAQD